MGAGGKVLKKSASNHGMLSVKKNGFEAALLDTVGQWLAVGKQLTVIACGMVGARQGWAEAPYVSVPAAPPVNSRLTHAPTKNDKMHVLIVPGMSQNEPSDVMRGEETIVAGFLGGTPDFDGVLCLTGTHTKWVHVASGQMKRFRTYISGELFSLLSRNSSLSHSIALSGWDDGEFLAAVSCALAKPENLTQFLFGIRAESLLRGVAPEIARTRLSGLLVGTEISSVAPVIKGNKVVVIGEGMMASAYVAGLAARGFTPEKFAPEPLVIAGLAAAHSALPAD